MAAAAAEEEHMPNKKYTRKENIKGSDDFTHSFCLESRAVQWLCVFVVLLLLAQCFVSLQKILTNSPLACGRGLASGKVL